MTASPATDSDGSRLSRIVRLEPSLVNGAIAAIITLAIAFGLPISVEQKAAILGVAAPLLALAQAFATREKVTPVAKPRKEDDASDDTNA